MIKSNTLSIVLTLIMLTVLTSCAGTKPFNHTARAGDTIAIGAGWKHQFSRDQLTVTITPSTGNDIIYLPNDPAVRASINLYADPASYMAVGYEAGLDGISYNFGSTYGSVVTSNHTTNDPDWWQTVVFVDLPNTLPTGTANINLVSNGSLGETWSVPVEIVAGTGEPHPFEADTIGSLTDYQIHTLERAPNFEIQFAGNTVPYAIQIELTHDANIGKPYIVNPRGDIKSVNWSDDGQHMKVLLNFTHTGSVRMNFKRFKFYVSGGVTGLQVQNVQAFDVNGQPVAGVSADIVNHY